MQCLQIFALNKIFNKLAAIFLRRHQVYSSAVHRSIFKLIVYLNQDLSHTHQ